VKVAWCSNDWSRGFDFPPMPGGAGYTRCRLPCAALNKFSEIECDHYPNFGFDNRTGEIVFQDWFDDVHTGYDVVVFQRFMQKDAPDIIKKAQSYGQVIINDCDDWYGGLATTNAAFNSTHPKNNPDNNRNHYNKVMAASDALWVSTPYLGSRLERTNPNIYVLRNMIDLGGFDLNGWVPKDVRDTTHPTLGWVGGTPWRSGDLESLRGVLGPVIEKHGLHFVHGGHHPQAPEASVTLGLQAGRAGITYMEPIDKYPNLFVDIDVGLVPLTDVPFNRAKSCLKGMEYSAAGIPFIGPNWGEYEWFGTGVLVGRPNEWVRAIERLCDPEERKKVRDEQLWRVQKEDAVIRWIDWAEAIKDLT
jgi:hypothetical protein